MTVTDFQQVPREPVITPGDGAESRIARDLARKALIVAPIVLVGVGLWRGWDAVLAAALAFVVVVANFLVSAAFANNAARISPNTLMAAMLGGFILRMAVIFGICLALEDVDAVDLPVFVVVVLVAHLGLLFWETRSVSLSLASPGLKPRNK